MHKVLAFMIAGALFVVSSGVALAGGFGECAYSANRKQVATEKNTTTKTEVTTSSEESTGQQLLLAQTDKPAKSASSSTK